MIRMAQVMCLTAAATMLLYRAADAQATRTTVAEAELAKEPNGTPLLHVARGVPLAVGSARNGWVQATIDGWVPVNTMRDDTRDGFDVSVSVAAGTTVRSRAPDGAPIATARLGALFDRVEVKNNWMHVKRTGWIPEVSFVAATRGTAPPPAQSVSPAAPPSAQATASTAISAGSALSLQADGAPFTTIEAPVRADVLERKNGWAHVKLDAWVRESSLGDALPPNGLTAAALRAAPDKYVGQTVEWMVQVIGVETADELRPELPLGQPYLLARGPLPESGFVYISVSKSQADEFRRLGPLAKVRIRATIRAGRSRFLPTPVLNFVRRLDQEGQ